WIAVRVAVVDQRLDGDGDIFHRVGEVVDGHRRIVGPARRERGGEARRGAAAVAVADRVANRRRAVEVGGREEHDVGARDAGRAVGRTDAGDRQRIAVRIAVVDQGWMVTATSSTVLVKSLTATGGSLGPPAV